MLMVCETEAPENLDDNSTNAVQPSSSSGVIQQQVESPPGCETTHTTSEEDIELIELSSDSEDESRK